VISRPTVFAVQIMDKLELKLMPHTKKTINVHNEAKILYPTKIFLKIDKYVLKSKTKTLQRAFSFVKSSLLSSSMAFSKPYYHSIQAYNKPIAILLSS